MPNLTVFNNPINYLNVHGNIILSFKIG